MMIPLLVAGVVVFELLLLYTGTHLISVVPLLVVGAIAVLYRSDLLHVGRYVAALGRSEEERRLGDVPRLQPATGPGEALLREVARLKQYFAVIDWNVRTEALERVRPIEEVLSCGELDPATLSAGVDERRFLLRLLQEIPKYFRSESSAILLESSDKRGCDILSLRPLERVGEPLKRFGQEVFGSHEQTPLGSFDTASFPGPLSALSANGYHAVIALPFQFSGKRRLLWLGYRGGMPPSAYEVSRAERLVNRVEQELASSRALIHLSQEVERAQALVKRKSDFVAHLSHDLRSPLNNIAAILRLFKLGGSQSETPELIEAALANCAAMEELMSDVLDFSRHQAGALVTRREWVSLSGMIEEVVDTYRVAARLKGLSMRVSLPESGKLEAYADRKQLRRILSNLVGNAVKYTVHGEIALRGVIVGEEKIRVEVADTGIGMTPEQVERVFAPFSRFAADIAEGVGLGLSLSRIFAELNGGELQVASSKGVGSTFSLELEGRVALSAVQENSIQLVSATPAVADETSGRSPIHVLVVDDDKDCVDALARSLERHSMRVTRTYSTPEALSVVNFSAPHIILSDGKMSCGGAESILHFLYRRRKSIPVIVLTGEQGEATRIRLLHLGASAVLVKPAPSAIVARAIEEALSVRPELRVQLG